MKTKLPNIESNTGRFIDGNPATGTLGTIVTAKWLNEVQERIQDYFEEFKNVLLLANMQPIEGTNNQVADAIKFYIGNLNASLTQKGLVQLANNLTTDDATKALTAAQGVAIKRRLDKFIINNNCQDDADTLVVDGIYSYGSGDMSNKNLPTSHNYYVQVISGDSPGWHRQVAMRAYSGDRYERYKLSFNGNWSPWKRADIGGLFGRFDSLNINLNDFKSDGVFSIGHATSRPVAHSGMLFVLSGGVEGRTGTLQRYTLHNKQECYERWFDASTNSWSNWARVDGAEWSTLRDKPTTVDGFGITDAVKKTGDTMTGILNINHAASYLRGKNNGVDDWFVGRVRDNDNDVALVSYQYSTGVHLKADRVESNKPIYHG
ncbi:hypothetical protein ACN9OU_11070, partial [Glaesserella parasuis]